MMLWEQTILQKINIFSKNYFYFLELQVSDVINDCNITKKASSILKYLLI